MSSSLLILRPRIVLAMIAGACLLFLAAVIATRAPRHAPGDTSAAVATADGIVPKPVIRGDVEMRQQFYACPTIADLDAVLNMRWSSETHDMSREARSRQCSLVDAGQKGQVQDVSDRHAAACVALAGTRSCVWFPAFMLTPAAPNP